MRFFSNTTLENQVCRPKSGINLYPFGQQMPGRNWNATIYRYGFNAKENDKEFNGGVQDYGFRVNDTRISRFFSVDPLKSKYPNLTPYQFASNSPIDGVDMDGQEWLTYQVLFENGGATLLKVIDHTNMSNARIEEVWNIPSTEFYKKHSKSFESRGQGVLYEYYVRDEKGNMKKIGDVMENMEKISTYGLYAGGGCVTYCGGNEDNYEKGIYKNEFLKAFKIKFEKTDYDFSRTPLDEYDLEAKIHDIKGSLIPNYDTHMNTPEALPSDREFLQGVRDYRERASSENFLDKYTGRPQSQDANINSLQGLRYFKLIEIPWKVIFLPTPIPPAHQSPSLPSPGSCTTRKICCFITGTRIEQMNSKSKKIEDVIKGDTVMSYNLTKHKIEPSIVVELSAPIQDSLIEIYFDDGSINVNTKDHPYYVLNKGWCSFKPDYTHNHYNVKAGKLEVGDEVIVVKNGKEHKVKIKNMQPTHPSRQTFNIFVEGNHNYFANGVLVYDETKLE
jgi:RHS repeat-associated protein